jgi:hypothetical protein
MRWAWLVLAGIFLGLAPASRPHLVFAVGAAWLCYFLYLFRSRRWRARSPELVVLTLPIVAAIAGILWYNWARFGSITEFGVRYMLVGTRAHQQQRMMLTNTPITLYNLLVSPPDLTSTFPFVRPRITLPIGIEWADLPTDYFVEPLGGAILAAPIVLAGLLLPLAFRRQQLSERAQPAIYAVYLASLVTMAVISLLGLSTERYLVDFTPGLVALGLVAALIVRESSAGRGRTAITGALVAALLWGVFVHAAFAITGPYDKWLQDAPAQYVRWANRVTPFEADRLLYNPRAAVELLVTFPQNPDGDDPLVSFGRDGAKYMLSAQVLAADRVRLYSTSTSDEHQVERTIAPGYPVRIRVEYDPATLISTVTWNGEVVIVHPQRHLITSRSQFLIGERDYQLTKFARRFRGSIRVVESRLEPGGKH